MRLITLLCGVLLSATTGCDDTAKAVKEEVREADLREADRKVRQAAQETKSEVKEAARELGKAVDAIDKTVANEIRDDDVDTTKRDVDRK